MGLGIGTGRGGRRVGAGRPKGVKTRWPPEIAAELRRLADGLQRLQQSRRDEYEALQPILRCRQNAARRGGRPTTGPLINATKVSKRTSGSVRRLDGQHSGSAGLGLTNGTRRRSWRL
jgi:hypothetical protein